MAVNWDAVAAVAGLIGALGAFEGVLELPGAPDWWTTYASIFPGAFRDYIDGRLKVVLSRAV